MAQLKPKLGFIGAGKVGTALALALNAASYPVVAVASRSFVSAEKLAGRLGQARAYAEAQNVVDAADIVFLTTPDDAIQATASALTWRQGVAVVHASGSASREALAAAAGAGADTGSLHPLQAFADADVAVAHLPGSVFGVEAEGALKQALRDMVESLQGRAVELSSEDKALYHASAAYAASYVVTLLKLATDIWATNFKWDRADSLRALLPALRGTVDNLETLGIPAALTGPIARGDTGTVGRNISAVRERAPEQAAIYEALALQAIPIGLEKGGLELSAAGDLRALLTKDRGLVHEGDAGGRANGRKAR
jgi:predicted short-subunit dehydrogenase-like oxidoreductase (DUF2520 family)